MITATMRDVKKITQHQDIRWIQQLETPCLFFVFFLYSKAVDELIKVMLTAHLVAQRITGVQFLLLINTRIV